MIWFLWKTYWFVKQVKLSCRDTRPGSTCGEVILWFGKSQEVGCMSELGILLDLSPASSMLRLVDVLSSSWQPSFATSGSRSWELDRSPTLPLLFPVFQLAAIRRLRAKGQILPKTDPNSVKRKRTDVEDVLEIVERVEKNVAQPQSAEADNGMYC